MFCKEPSLGLVILFHKQPFVFKVKATGGVVTGGVACWDLQCQSTAAQHDF